MGHHDGDDEVGIIVVTIGCVARETVLVPSLRHTLQIIMFTTSPALVVFAFKRVGSSKPHHFFPTFLCVLFKIIFAT